MTNSRDVTEHLEKFETTAGSLATRIKGQRDNSVLARQMNQLVISGWRIRSIRRVAIRFDGRVPRAESDGNVAWKLLLRNPSYHHLVIQSNYHPISYNISGRLVPSLKSSCRKFHSRLNRSLPINYTAVVRVSSVFAFEDLSRIDYREIDCLYDN